MKPKLFFKTGITLLLILSLMPVVFSFECNKFQGITKIDCLALNESNEDLIATLIIPTSSTPDHFKILDYNSKITVSSPLHNQVLISSSTIKDVWIKIFYVSPSVIFQDKIYVSNQVSTFASYGYSVKVPDKYTTSQTNSNPCQIIYSLNSQSEVLNWFNDDKLRASGKNANISISKNSSLEAQLEIKTTIKADKSNWRRYCCSTRYGRCIKYCNKCEYANTAYQTESLLVSDSKEVALYNSPNEADIALVNNYFNTTKGLINNSEKADFKFQLENSSLIETNFEFNARFSDKAYYFIELEAKPKSNTIINNLLYDKPYFFASNLKNCTLENKDFFKQKIETCNLNFLNESVEPFKSYNSIPRIGLLLKVVGIILAIFVLSIFIKRNFRKLTPFFFILLFLLPSVKAEDCGLTNLASCIPEKIYDFSINLINSPLQPLLSFIKSMIENAPNIDLFHGVWVIIIYCISILYAFLIMYAGLQFLASGHDIVKREMAKEWLKNTVLMITLIQASFYLYGLVLETGALMSSGVLSLVDSHFFLLTADNLSNVGLEFMLTFSYLLVLLLTAITFVIRYLVVAFGVVFLPIAIFCYFIPPIKSYGRLAFQLLGMCIFITFLDAIILLACSKLIEITVFQNMKILVMICAFLITNLLFIILTLHIINKSGIQDTASKVGDAVKYVGALL